MKPEIVRAYIVNQDSEEHLLLNAVLGEMDRIDGYPIAVVYFADRNNERLRHTNFIIIEREDDAQLLVDLLNPEDQVGH